ncbi:MAG TPA: hypothetical protein VIJ15_09545, partial [Dermatophilaceae bacterium]
MSTERATSDRTMGAGLDKHLCPDGPKDIRAPSPLPSAATVIRASGLRWSPPPPRTPVQQVLEDARRYAGALRGAEQDGI